MTLGTQECNLTNLQQDVLSGVLLALGPPWIHSSNEEDSNTASCINAVRALRCVSKGMLAAIDNCDHYWHCCNSCRYPFVASSQKSDGQSTDACKAWNTRTASLHRRMWSTCHAASQQLAYVPFGVALKLPVPSSLLPAQGTGSCVQTCPGAHNIFTHDQRYTACISLGKSLMWIRYRIPHVPFPRSLMPDHVPATQPGDGDFAIDGGGTGNPADPSRMTAARVSSTCILAAQTQGHTGGITTILAIPTCTGSSHPSFSPCGWATASTDHTIKLWQQPPFNPCSIPSTQSAGRPGSSPPQDAHTSIMSSSYSHSSSSGTAGNSADSAGDLRLPWHACKLEDVMVPDAGVLSVEDVVDQSDGQIKPARTLRHHDEAVTCLTLIPLLCCNPAGGQYADGVKVEGYLVGSGSADKTLCISSLAPLTSAPTSFRGEASQRDSREATRSASSSSKSQSVKAKTTSSAKLAVMRGHDKAVTSLLCVVLSSPHHATPSQQVEGEEAAFNKQHISHSVFLVSAALDGRVKVWDVTTLCVSTDRNDNTALTPGKTHLKQQQQQATCVRSWKLQGSVKALAVLHDRCVKTSDGVLHVSRSVHASKSEVTDIESCSSEDRQPQCQDVMIAALTTQGVWLLSMSSPALTDPVLLMGCHAGGAGRSQQWSSRQWSSMHLAAHGNTLAVAVGSFIHIWRVDCGPGSYSTVTARHRLIARVRASPPRRFTSLHVDQHKVVGVTRIDHARSHTNNNETSAGAVYAWSTVNGELLASFNPAAVPAVSMHVREACRPHHERAAAYAMDSSATASDVRDDQQTQSAFFTRAPASVGVEQAKIRTEDQGYQHRRTETSLSAQVEATADIVDSDSGWTDDEEGDAEEVQPSGQHIGHKGPDVLTVGVQGSVTCALITQHAQQAPHAGRAQSQHDFGDIAAGVGMGLGQQGDVYQDEGHQQQQAGVHSNGSILVLYHLDACTGLLCSE